jgi:dephospho-CoA kinase
MSFVLGLTGSIGMGKSTAAAMFAAEAVPVWDADAAVHRLYSPGGAGAAALAKDFPEAILADGSVDRVRLRSCLRANPGAMDLLNALVHPLVAQDRAAFLQQNAKAKVVVLDVPLLYETGLDRACDAVAVVSAPAEVQRARVLARGMTEDELALILARQMPDAEKRRRASYVIPSVTLEDTRAAVKDVLADIQRRTDPHA